MTIRSDKACFNEVVVYENGFNGCGALRVGSDDAIPCEGRVDETSRNGLGKDLSKFAVLG